MKQKATNRVSLVEFRRSAARILARISRGERIVLTRRGRPMARLEPIAGEPISGNDPIYRLGEAAVDGGRPLTNRQIDREVYGL